MERRNGNPAVYDIHLLSALLDQQESIVVPILQKLGASVTALRERVQREMARYPKQTDAQPTRKGGFAYMRGPDDAIVEYMQDPTAERMNHVHFIHEQPFCAQLWYQKHLNATPLKPRPGTPAADAPPRTEANCKVERSPEPTWPALEPQGFATRACRRRPEVQEPAERGSWRG